MLCRPYFGQFNLLLNLLGKSTSANEIECLTKIFCSYVFCLQNNLVYAGSERIGCDQQKYVLLLRTVGTINGQPNLGSFLVIEFFLWNFFFQLFKFDKTVETSFAISLVRLYLGNLFIKLDALPVRTQSQLSQLL